MTLSNTPRNYRPKKMKAPEFFWVELTHVADGMFPTEKMVRFDTVDGDMSVFAPTSDVVGSKLKVRVLDEYEGRALVSVPSTMGESVVCVVSKAVAA